MYKIYIRRVILSLILMSILLIPAISQSTQLDIIYLKNGSIIKGYITEYNKDNKITIKTIDEYTLEFQLDDVEIIKREETKNELNPPGFYLDKGFINYTTLGLLVGNGNNNKQAPFSLMMTNSYLFANRISLGGGFGLEFFEESMLPVYLDLKYHFNNRKISPYTSLKTGYSFSLDKKRTSDDYWNYEQKCLGGYLVNAEMGMTINLQSYNALIFSFGYRHQLLSYIQDYPYEIKTGQYYNRFSIRFGFVFR